MQCLDLLPATPAPPPRSTDEVAARATGEKLKARQGVAAFGRHVRRPITAQDCTLRHRSPMRDWLYFGHDGDSRPKCSQVRARSLAASSTPDLPPRRLGRTPDPLSCPGPALRL